MNSTTAQIIKRQPWHGTSEGRLLKQVKTSSDAPLTIDNVLAVAGMDWSVEAVQSTYPFNGETRNLAGRSVVVRSDTGASLGSVVGTTSYKIGQNTELTDLAKAILEQSAEPLRIYSAGYLGDGHLTYLEVAFPNDLVIEGDVFRKSLLIHSGHGGTASRTVTLMRTRLSCTNQLNRALREKKFRISFKHSSRMTAEAMGVVARDQLGILPQIDEEFEAEVRRLIETPIAVDAEVKILTKLFSPAEVTERSKTIAANRVAAVMGLKNSKQVGYDGTLWGLTQAVSTWDQHSFGEKKTAEERLARTFEATLTDKSGIMDRLAILIDRELANV